MIFLKIPYVFDKIRYLILFVEHIFTKNRWWMITTTTTNRHINIISLNIENNIWNVLIIFNWTWWLSMKIIKRRVSYVFGKTNGNCFYWFYINEDADCCVFHTSGPKWKLFNLQKYTAKYCVSWTIVSNIDLVTNSILSSVRCVINHWRTSSSSFRSPVVLQSNFISN